MIIFTWWCTNILVAYRSRQYIILFEKIFLSLSNYLLDYIRIFKASDDTDCETYIYTHTHTHTHRKHFSENVCAYVPSHVRLFAPLAMEFSRQEYLSRLPFPAPGLLPDPGIKPVSPACAALVVDFFPLCTWKVPRKCTHVTNMGLKKHSYRR